MACAQVELKAVLNNKQNSEYCAPLTSFDWNENDINRIGTSSIDTTCTIWDIEKEVVDTQLIAHDKEVYDIAWGGARLWPPTPCNTLLTYRNTPVEAPVGGGNKRAAVDNGVITAVSGSVDGDDARWRSWGRSFCVLSVHPPLARASDRLQSHTRWLPNRFLSADVPATSLIA